MIISLMFLPVLTKTFQLLNGFDLSVLKLFNTFSQRSWNFDQLMKFVAGSDLVKAGLIVSALWWFWFRYTDAQKERNARERIISALAAAVFTLFLVRFLAYVLPFRARPSQNPALNFLLPFGTGRGEVSTWSSFPSDHAALFFPLAVGIWSITKRLGWLLLAYVFFIICLPRIYLGLHYPTDILAGALLGILMAGLANTKRARSFIAGPVLKWQKKSPALFYVCFFLLTSQIADLFIEVRRAGAGVLMILHHVFLK